MKLTAKQISKMDDSMFGLPKEKKYPMPDKAHVTKAIQFFKYAKGDERKELAKNINRRIKELGMKVTVGKDSAFYPYLPKEFKGMKARKEGADYIEEFHAGSLSPIVPTQGEVLKKPMPYEDTDGDEEYVDELIQEMFHSYRLPYENRTLVDERVRLSSNSISNMEDVLNMNRDMDNTIGSYKNPIKNTIRDLRDNVDEELSKVLAISNPSKDDAVKLACIISSYMDKRDCLRALCKLIKHKQYLPYINAIYNIYNKNEKDIPYLPNLPVEHDMSGCDDIKDIFWVFNTDDSAPVLTNPSFNFNFNLGRYRDICEEFNENESPLGRDFDNSCVKLIDKNKNLACYKSAVVSRQMMTMPNTQLIIKYLMKKKKLYDGYYIPPSNPYTLYVIKDGAIYKLYYDTTPDAIYVFMGLLYDEKDPEYYERLENSFLLKDENTKATIRYRVSKISLLYGRNQTVKEYSKMKVLNKAFHINTNGEVKLEPLS